MSQHSSGIPAGSQTVGPYFRIGLESLIDRTPVPDFGTGETIEIRGRVLDRDGVPVPDAMLEFWSGAGVEQSIDSTNVASGIPAGFRRVATDESGAFAVKIARPAGELLSAPHFLVLVFARGLLRHLLTRVYLGDEVSNDSDIVLQQVPAERRAVLIARPDEKQAGLYFWDIVLQGTNETVFFAW